MLEGLLSIEEPYKSTQYNDRLYSRAVGNCVGMVVGVAGMTAVKFCMLQLLPEQHSTSQSSKVMLPMEELNAAQIASLSKVKKKHEVN